MSAYVYAGNQPTVFIDPSGLVRSPGTNITVAEGGCAVGRSAGGCVGGALSAKDIANGPAVGAGAIAVSAAATAGSLVAFRLGQFPGLDDRLKVGSTSFGQVFTGAGLVIK